MISRRLREQNTALRKAEQHTLTTSHFELGPTKAILADSVSLTLQMRTLLLYWCAYWHSPSAEWGTLSLRWFIPFLHRMLETRQKTKRFNATWQTSLGDGGIFYKSLKDVYRPLIQDWIPSESLLWFLTLTHTSLIFPWRGHTKNRGTPIFPFQKYGKHIRFYVSQWGDS